MSDDVSTDVLDLMPGDGGEAVEAEANGDVTSPVGDIDSEATDSDISAETGEEAESPSDDVEDAEADADAATEGVEQDPEDEAWLPGFEGRFRVGEEGQALAAYQQLEKEFSGRKELEEKFREQLAQEREAAFEQARKLLAQPEQQRSALQTAQERSQLIGLSYSDPKTAFRAALESGDVDTVNAVIGAVAQGDEDLGVPPNPGAAVQLQAEYQNQQMQAALEQQRQEYQRIQGTMNLQQAYGQFQAEYADALSIPEINGELQRVVQDNLNEFDTSTPEAASSFLSKCADIAIGRALRSGALSQLTQQGSEETPAPAPAQRPARKTATVETGMPTRAVRETKPSEADEIADDILAAARHLKPQI